MILTNIKQCDDTIFISLKLQAVLFFFYSIYAVFIVGIFLKFVLYLEFRLINSIINSNQRFLRKYLKSSTVMFMSNLFYIAAYQISSTCCVMLYLFWFLL